MTAQPNPVPRRQFSVKSVRQALLCRTPQGYQSQSISGAMENATAAE